MALHEGSRTRLLESWLALHEFVRDDPALSRLLFDPVTGLPTTPLLFPRIESLLTECGEISLLYVQVVKYSHIEEIYGWEVFDGVVRKIALILDRIAGEQFRDTDMVAELMIAGNAFVVVLSPPRTLPNAVPEHLDRLARRIETRVREELAEVLDPALYSKFGCYIGAATVQHDEKARLERLVHSALEAALTEANAREHADGQERVERLRAIIEDGAVRTLVHPVFRLDDASVIGYEALSRGPEGEFERPDKLFSVAYDADLVIELERLCRKRAFDIAADLPDGRLLFVNIEPDVVADPELREAIFASAPARDGFSPSRVVLEITERTAVVDYMTFRSTLEYLRHLGFHIAIDDAGAGFGSLQCLAEVRPEWLKVDISLVRDVDTDDVRRQLVASLVEFGKRTNVKIIAEGIERAAQLETLREIGVEYGQGFYFCGPVEPYPADADVRPKEL